MAHRTEITAFFSVDAPRRVLLSIAALMFFAGAARPATAPYIADVVGREDIERSPVRGRTENGDLRLLGTFKLFNPDTVPFYIWVSFENGGKFTHTRRGGKSPTIRLTDLELRYKNAQHRPIVKAFLKNGGFSGGGGARAYRRSAWGSSSSGSAGATGRAARFGKKKPHQARSLDAGDEPAVSDGGAARGARGVGSVEIVFWREDVQSYYEMELWGVLYAPDVKEADAPGRYIENITFEVEAAR